MNKLSTLIATTSLFGTLACGGAPQDFHATSNGIVEGVSSSVTDYPSAGVMLVTESDASGDGGGMACTGTLISPDVVLTAAHCLVDQEYISQEYPGLTVKTYFSFELDVSQFGVAHLDLPTGAVEVAKQVGHPEYGKSDSEPEPGLGNDRDIALLFLKKPVEGVTPAPLVREQDRARLIAGAQVHIAGYGQRERTANSETAGIKFHGRTFIREVNDGEMQVGGLENEAGRGPSKCYGDSGGPTYIEVDGVLRVIGVTSRSYNHHDDCDTAGVDTRVDAFLPWIKQEMKKACDEGISKCGEDVTPVEPAPEPTEPEPTKPEPTEPTKPEPTKPAPMKPAPKADPSNGFTARRDARGCDSSGSADMGALWLFGLAGILIRRRCD